MTLVRVEIVVFSGTPPDVDSDTLATNEWLFEEIRSVPRGRSLTDCRLASVTVFVRIAVLADVVVVDMAVVWMVSGIAGGAFPQRRVKGIDA